MIFCHSSVESGFSLSTRRLTQSAHLLETLYKLRLLSQGEIPAYFSKFTPLSAPYDLVEEVEVTGP